MKNAIYGLTATAIAAAAILSPAPAYAQFTLLSIDLNQSYYLNTGRNITRVAIANPKIADVSLLDGTSLNVIGISPGTTTLNVWASNGYRYEYRITVSNQDSGLAKNRPGRHRPARRASPDDRRQVPVARYGQESV